MDWFVVRTQGAQGVFVVVVSGRELWLLWYGQRCFRIIPDYENGPHCVSQVVHKAHNTREQLSNLLEEESIDDQDKEDEREIWQVIIVTRERSDRSDADEREIWQVIIVTEEDVETTEGESVDLLDKLMELMGGKS